MLYGWWDFVGLADVVPGGSASLRMSDMARTVINAARNYIDTCCMSGSVATHPWNMPAGFKWARYLSKGYNISTKYTSIGNIYIKM